MQSIIEAAHEQTPS